MTTAAGITVHGGLEVYVRWRVLPLHGTRTWDVHFYRLLAYVLVRFVSFLCLGVIKEWHSILFVILCVVRLLCICNNVFVILKVHCIYHGVNFFWILQLLVNQYATIRWALARPALCDVKVISAFGNCCWELNTHRCHVCGSWVPVSGESVTWVKSDASSLNCLLLFLIHTLERLLITIGNKFTVTRCKFDSLPFNLKYLKQLRFMIIYCIFNMITILC